MVLTSSQGPMEESRHAQNGPDQVISANTFTTTDINGFVRLRVEESSPSPGAEADFSQIEPISVPSLLKSVAEKAGDHPALAVKREGEWQKWSFHDYYATVRKVAKAFIQLGLEPRHGVSILGFNAPEWFFSELGAIFAGGVSTGIYPTNNSDACKHILVSSKSNILIVEDQNQLDKIMPFAKDLKDLKKIIQYIGKPSQPDVMSWSDLLALGEAQGNEQLEERLRSIAINQCCHLVYTSGTTGNPKGTMLSHDNITFTAKSISKTFKLTEMFERHVSYLPLSHVAANVTDIFVMMASMATVYFADRDALKGTLVDTLKEALPTVFLGVPRVWEKIQEKMQEVGKSTKGIKRQIGSWAKRVGWSHNQLVLSGQSDNSFSYWLANTLAFSKIKEALGLNHCHGFYAAAAPMAMDTLNYFLSIDMRILEIYGMSECSGPQLTNTMEQQKIGSIGKSFLGFETKLKPVDNEEIVEEGGEICMKGRNIMMGYLNDSEKTSEAIDKEGFLHSGDLGVEESDGFYKLTGRIKELLITAGGENIPPVIIEETIKAELPCLSNVMVIGDRRKFLTCLIAMKTEIDPDTQIPTRQLSRPALDWVSSVGSQASSVDDILTGPDTAVMKAIDEGIKRANANATSRAQKVQKWALLKDDFSLPGGELGPTLKVKRHVVLKRYAEKIESFYA